MPILKRNPFQGASQVIRFPSAVIELLSRKRILSPPEFFYHHYNTAFLDYKFTYYIFLYCDDNSRNTLAIISSSAATLFLCPTGYPNTLASKWSSQQIQNFNHPNSPPSTHKSQYFCSKRFQDHDFPVIEAPRSLWSYTGVPDSCELGLCMTRFISPRAPT